MNKLLNQFKEIVQTTFGSGALDPLSTTIPTGIDILDKYSGGGVVLGTFNTIAGLPHTGKSTLAIQIAKQIQSLYPEAIIVYFDSENAVTVKRLKSLGIDTERLLFVSSVITVEKFFKTLDNFIAIKQKNKEENVPTIIIWDSVAFTTTERVVSETDIQNTDGMIRAKIIAEYIPRYIGKLHDNNIAILAINQLREAMNLNAYQGAGITIKGLGNYTMPGGSTLYFASFHMLVLKVKELLDPATYGFQGAVVECKFVKNKLSRPLKPFYLVLDVDKGFSNFWSYFYYMKNIVKTIKPGSWYSIDGYDKKFRLKEAESLYLTDETFREAFNQQCKKVLEYIDKDLSVESQTEKENNELNSVGS